MNYAKLADFFVTGLIVVWPVMVWSGNLVPGIVVCALLVIALLWCEMMDDDRDGGGPGGPGRRDDAGNRVAIRISNDDRNPRR